jgi:mannose-6-phosphate isomerase-like protein (cupin superfamily)
MVLKLLDRECFLAGDHTRLRELLHPSTNPENTLFSMAHAFLEKGETSLPHRLKNSSETYFFLDGEGEIHIEGQVFRVSKNDTAFVPANATQWVKNTGRKPLVFLCIVSPPWSATDEEVLVQPG